MLDHCPWINSCVGLYNYRWFLSYLFLHVVACCYTVYLVYSLIYGVFTKRDLLNATFRGPDGAVFRANYSILFNYITYHYGAAIGIAIFCIIIAIVLGFFLLYHFYLISRNTTTRETSRLEDLQDLVATFPEVTEEPDLKFESTTSGTCNANEFHASRLPNRVDEEMLNISLIAREKIRLILDVNFYDFGTFKNFKEVILAGKK